MATPPKSNRIIVSVYVSPLKINIESLKNTLVSVVSQTKKADIVYLVTSKENAKNPELKKLVKKILPGGLGKILALSGGERGKGEYGSLGNLIGPLMVESDPNDVIITIQCGTVYKPELINSLYESHTKFPDAVICMNGHTVGKFPNMWGTNTTSSPEILHIEPGSRVDIIVGSEGVLYPRAIFSGLDIPNSAMEDMRTKELKELNKFEDLYMSAWIDILKKEKRLAEHRVISSTSTSSSKSIKGYWTVFKALRSRGLLISGIKVKWYKSMITLSTIATLTAFTLAIGVVIVYSSSKSKSVTKTILKGEV